MSLKTCTEAKFANNLYFCVMPVALSTAFLRNVEIENKFEENVSYLWYSILT